jgi:hypothetical protein
VINPRHHSFIPNHLEKHIPLKKVHISG